MIPYSIGRLLVGSVFIGFFGAVISVVGLDTEKTEMRLEPNRALAELGKPFEVQLIVQSSTPVNAYSGLLKFDPAILRVDNISYNTSIANLWVEEPWYENGAGTLTFAGGTTDSGGFIGTGSLLTITFTSIAEGAAALQLTDAHILAHNGFGTDIPLEDPIDGLFTVEAMVDSVEKNAEGTSESEVIVLESMQTTDINGDGKVNLVDVSIFMRSLFSGNLEHDFNSDGKTNLADLSILLDSRTQ